MSDPILQRNSKIFDAVAMTADRTSEVINLAAEGGYAVHAIWTGSPVGDLLVQGSNDGVNFVTVNTQAAGGTDGQHLLNVERQHYVYMRVLYDFTSGTGSLTAYVSGKNI